MKAFILGVSATLFTTGLLQAEEHVQVISDLPYLGEGRTETLDLYLPATSLGSLRRPAILIVHGGGWHGGDKAAAREKNIGTTLAGAGYVCASVNYVLAEKKEKFIDNLRQVWPRNLQDCMTAVRFLRQHADEYQIDPQKIGAIGGSAGGHLVATLATVSDGDGLDPNGPYAEFSCRIQAVVPMYGAHDLLQMARSRELLDGMTKEETQLCRVASPVSHLTKDDPPALILHGTEDKLVPVEQSEILHREWQKAGLKSQLLVIEGAPHSFHLQPKQRDLRPLVIGFFDRHLKAGKSPAPPKVVKDFPTLPEGMVLGAVSGVEIDRDGNVLVFHRGRHSILVFSPEGEFLRSFGDGFYDSTHFLRRDPDGLLWTTDNKNHTVLALDASGKVLRTYGERNVPGKDARHFDRPADIAFGTGGTLFVADGYGNSRVAKFDPSGELLLEWGEKGTGDGEFDLPHAIRIDSKGLVYVGDRENDRIQVFDQQGKYLRQFGGFAPFGLHIDTDDTLYVADGRANKIIHMTLEGTVLEEWGEKGPEPGNFNLPHGIVVAPDGAIYVAEVGGKRVQKFVR
ncbi:MAG: prolyl oligopeptidase family serine peptidase [Verrucomicrobiae bacterium]|nr:prolyl oligopeptidase family serine peptidase [Verrucomicrobiae bacterium]